MSRQRSDKASYPSMVLPMVYSAGIIVLGLWVSISTGEWVAMICAAGLVVLPLGHRRTVRSSTTGATT
jgi:hypothetical protein